MLDVPASLNEWTYETIENIVREHEREPGPYEYKTVLNAQGSGEHVSKHIASIRRTACAMANGEGGYILFGVQDRHERASVSNPIERILGISLDDDHPKHFQDKIKVIQPGLYFDALASCIRLPGDPERGLFVVHIPRSPRRPHMDESTGACYRRGSGGAAEVMRIREVREQMVNTEERLLLQPQRCGRTWQPKLRPEIKDVTGEDGRP